MYIQRHGERSLHSPFKPQHSLHSPAVQFSSVWTSLVEFSLVQFNSVYNLHRIWTVQAPVLKTHNLHKSSVQAPVLNTESAQKFSSVKFKHQFKHQHRTLKFCTRCTFTVQNCSELFTVKFSQHNQFRTLIKVPAIQFTMTDRCTFSNIQSAKWQLSHSTKFSLPNSAKSQYQVQLNSANDNKHSYLS
jgi:hypothetical protein